MTRLHQIALTLIIATLSSYASAELALIVHPSNNVESLSRAQVKNIFLGKVKRLPNGTMIDPVEIRKGILKEQFLQKVVKKSPQQISAYWSRMVFSGNAFPPHQLESLDVVKDWVAKNQNAIGYIDKAALDTSVKTVMIK